MKIKSQKDFYSGLMFLGIGLAFAGGATTYQVGTGARMGSGYFPLVLGSLLALIGAVITVKATVVHTEDGDKIGKWGWRPLLLIVLGNFAFGILLVGLPRLGIAPMGLIVAIYGLTFIEVFIVATLLAVGSYAAFVLALKLQFPVWPSFISG